MRFSLVVSLPRPKAGRSRSASGSARTASGTVSTAAATGASFSHVSRFTVRTVSPASFNPIMSAWSGPKSEPGDRLSTWVMSPQGPSRKTTGKLGP
jgi:hypothetical protein